MEQRHPVAKGQEGRAQPVRPHTLLRAGVGDRHLPHRAVVERLVVVDANKVDDLLRVH